MSSERADRAPGAPGRAKSSTRALLARDFERIGRDAGEIEFVVRKWHRRPVLIVQSAKLGSYVISIASP